MLRYYIAFLSDKLIRKRPPLYTPLFTKNKIFNYFVDSFNKRTNYMFINYKKGEYDENRKSFR